MDSEVIIGLSLDLGGLGEDGLTVGTWKVNILTIGQHDGLGWIHCQTVTKAFPSIVHWIINVPTGSLRPPEILISTGSFMSIGFGWILDSEANDSDQSLPAILSLPWSYVQWPV